MIVKTDTQTLSRNPTDIRIVRPVYTSSPLRLMEAGARASHHHLHVSYPFKRIVNSAIIIY